MDANTDRSGLPPEAEVVIDGQKLTPAQSMALRVACTSYMSQMNEPAALGDDEHGRSMAKHYHRAMGEIVTMLIRSCDRQRGSRA